jgi:hypothetical protein
MWFWVSGGRRRTDDLTASASLAEPFSRRLDAAAPPAFSPTAPESLSALARLRDKPFRNEIVTIKNAQADDEQAAFAIAFEMNRQQKGSLE